MSIEDEEKQKEILKGEISREIELYTTGLRDKSAYLTFDEIQILSALLVSRILGVKDQPSSWEIDLKFVGGQEVNRSSEKMKGLLFGAIKTVAEKFRSYGDLGNVSMYIPEYGMDQKSKITLNFG